MWAVLGYVLGLAVLVQVGACMGSNLLLRRTTYTKYTVCTTYYVSKSLEGSMKLAYSHCLLIQTFGAY